MNDSASVQDRERILITGGSGFIGTNAVEHYSSYGFEVRSLDAREPRWAKHASLWRKCDLLDLRDVQAACDEFRPHYILHLGARTDFGGRDTDAYAANVTGVSNMVEAARAAHSLRRIIFASSRQVCQVGYQAQHDEDYSPANPYGLSKALGEKIVRRGRLECEWLIVRPTSIWGPWFDIPYKLFFEAIRAGRFFNCSNKDPYKSVGFVGNTIDQLSKLFTAPAEQVNRRILYLCDYPPTSLRVWAELIRNSMSAPRIRTLPHAFLRVAAAGGDLIEWLGADRVPLTSLRLHNLIQDMTYDTKGLEEICGPLKYSVEQGVRITAEWMRTQGEESVKPAKPALWRANKCAH